jgi:hypothetical protein
VSTATAVAAASTTVEATTAAATVEAATAAAVAACAATIPTRYTAAGIAARAAYITVTGISAAITVSAAIPVAAAIAVSAMTPAPVIPGADADKDAAVEPVRTVIAIRCASVGVIRIIAPRAIRRAVIAGSRHHRRSNSNPYRDLGIRRDSGERKNYKRCQHN